MFDHGPLPGGEVDRAPRHASPKEGHDVLVTPDTDEGSTAVTHLELKLVGDIQGRCLRRARGYRRGDAEVERLLEDIWASEGKP